MKRLLRRMTCRVAPDAAPLPPPAAATNMDNIRSVKVPAGHVPVHVGEGDETERFVVPAELLGRPAIADLLRRSAQEYGYGQRGPLRILCPAAAFRWLLGALVDGAGAGRGDGGLGFAYGVVV